MLLSACGRADTPEEGVRQWLSALAAGDSSAAYAALCESSQARLQQAAVAWAAGKDDPLAPHTAVPADPDGRSILESWMTANGMLPDLPANSANLVGTFVIQGQNATCSVRGPFGEVPVALVLEGGSWRVQLKLP
ncbi:MAG: hypothetical protein EXS14_04950 [Planctomycetes bacterium]|nr:hypothetical protein [Planctomycetota bacterium]